METAIMGLPGAGKTTFFNALSERESGESGYRGGARKASKANIADVQVPDERVERLYDLFRPKKKALATVCFKDLQLEFTNGRGIAAAWLAELRSVDALTLVIRAFEDQTVAHPLGEVNPVRDFNHLLDALVFSDYEVAEKRVERLVKEGKKGEREHQRLVKICEHLEQGRLLGQGFFTPEDRSLFSGFAFLTAKPLIVVANTGEQTADTRALEQAVATKGLTLFHIQGKAEMEIAQLDPDEQTEFLEHLGIDEAVKNRFLRTIYAELNLVSFLTAGEDEVRAWSIPRDTPAMRAAGKIHSDLERGFIRAEVVEWSKLLEAGGFKEAKRCGVMRLEGKEYPIKDGDVLTIRFNV
jgi:GTP-binding protein YchF